MKEELLYFVWQLQRYDRQAVVTTQGQPLTVLAPGMRNTHSGPDFANARVHLDGIEWFGSVEIHVNASDWNAHQHQHDEAYNRVVLHVVWHADRAVYRPDGTTMPTLVLKDRVDPTLLRNYRQLVFQAPEQRTIPCATALPHVDELPKVATLEKAGVLRLERKSQEVLRSLEKNRGDWSLTAYQLLLRSFGFRVNSAPFEQLSYALPLSLVVKYQRDFDTLVALLLGQAGLLDDEQWPAAWRTQYQFLSKKYQLRASALARSQWKFFRTRPANFPTVRTVQLAALLASCPGGITGLFACRPKAEQYSILGEGNARLPAGVSALGIESIHRLLINAVVPYQFAYGSFFRQQEHKEHALSLLQTVPPEKNQLVKKYRGYGLVLPSAFETQAVLELHRSFCQEKRCLSCTIGGSIVKNNKIFVTSLPH